MYTITLNDGTKLNYQANPSIKDGVLLLFSLVDKSLIASYSAGCWRSIVKSTEVIK